MAIFKFHLTIKRMLTGLVVMGILGTAVLALLSLHSNSNLMESQKWLTMIVVPLDAVTQRLRVSAMEITIRRHQIREAKSSAELDQIVELRRIRQAYEKGIGQIRAIATDAAIIRADESLPEQVTRVETLYAALLEKDSAVLESAQGSLELGKRIRQQIEVTNAAGARLHKNAEAFSLKLGPGPMSHPSGTDAPDRGSESASPETAERRPPGTGKQREVSERLGQARENIASLRLFLALLANHRTQMLLADEADQISNIRTDNVIQSVKQVRETLESLSGLPFGDETAALETIRQEMRSDLDRLSVALIDEKDGMATLRGQWLAERKNMDLRESALKLATDSLSASLESIQGVAEKVHLMAKKEAARISDSLSTAIWTVTLMAVAFMVLTGWLIIRRIIIPINKAINFAETIAQGDLTAEIQKDHNDEVGTLVSKLSEMAQNLNALIGQVQRSGIQVTSSATELSATSKQQEAVMRTQLESTNYVVASVGEISTVSEDLVETMKKVATMSDQTADFASSGQSDLSQMEEAMHHMENASKSISGKLEAINEKAANITSVVTTITKVADQTNLLSLNAAIEAEKAGEYGRGFTVVAREIRRLADQTAVATLDIDQMVQEMQSAVSAGVMEMDAFITEVQRSAENVGKISMQLSRIIEQVQALSPSFEGVNESMQFQAEKAQQINNSMVSLSEEMQQTVDSLRESFMAIEQLNDAASGLQDEVSRFRVM